MPTQAGPTCATGCSPTSCLPSTTLLGSSTRRSSTSSLPEASGLPPTSTLPPSASPAWPPPLSPSWSPSTTCLLPTAASGSSQVPGAKRSPSQSKSQRKEAIQMQEGEQVPSTAPSQTSLFSNPSRSEQATSSSSTAGSHTDQAQTHPMVPGAPSFSPTTHRKRAINTSLTTNT